ncbi:MAG: 50S ribosomal protein L9 [Lachnospiraceae bacterium]|nr:50S ribosomal protein L9 [Lachnospiraceae bacterium]
MEIILLQDVKSLGKKGEIVKVNEGYARNFILPKKLGVEANNKNINDLKLQKANADKIAKQQLEDAKVFAAKIEEKPVTVGLKTGENGKLFGSISTKEIAVEAKKQLGFEIDKKKIQLDEPIKTLGTHIISVKVHREVTAKLTVKVVETK